MPVYESETRSAAVADNADRTAFAYNYRENVNK